MRNTIQAVAAVAATLIPSISAVNITVTDKTSIKNAASLVAHDLMTYYTGNITNTPETVGVLPAPLYWWEAGALWGLLLNYYHYTGDDSYNNVTTQALLSQVGPNYDYMVPRHEKDEGNDDQAFWGFATMTAAEQDYPQPTVGNYSWLELTENLWNTQVPRWDTEYCGGGLRWQIFSFNNGWNYKNSVSNGAFFQLAARLARFTGNQTYYDWAEKSYNWSIATGLIDDGYDVFDGADTTTNCTTQDKIIWTYNVGIYLYGSAVLYNYTNGSALWQQRTQGFLNSSAQFFTPFDNATNVMYEPACETVNTCDNDQYSFKGYLSRFMYSSTIMAPFTKNAVYSLLTPSVEAVASACTGSTDGVACGQKWYTGGFDNKPGVGQQMSALETIQGLLIDDSVAPLHSGQVHLMNPTTTTSPAPVPTPTATSTPKKGGASTISNADWIYGLTLLGVLAGTQ